MRGLSVLIHVAAITGIHNLAIVLFAEWRDPAKKIPGGENVMLHWQASSIHPT